MSNQYRSTYLSPRLIRKKREIKLSQQSIQALSNNLILMLALLSVMLISVANTYWLMLIQSG